MVETNISSLSLHFNGHFPGGPGLAGTRMSPFWILLELRMTEVLVTTGATRCAKLQSNRHHQQTNTQFFYRPDALPVAQPNNCCCCCYYYYTCLKASFHDNLCKPVADCETILGVAEAENDEGDSGENCISKTCKSFALRSSRITTTACQHSALLPAGSPSCCTT